MDECSLDDQAKYHKLANEYKATAKNTDPTISSQAAHKEPF